MKPAHWVTALLASALGLGLGAVRAAGPPAVAAVNGVEQGKRWSALTPTERTALQPLEHEWSRIPADNKQKWLEVASRLPKMAPAERERIQARMAAWAKLTPLERGQARLHYQEAKQVAPADRKAQWEAYQALPPERRRELAARAARPEADDAARRRVAPGRGDKAPAPSSGKSTALAVPSPAVGPRPVAPMMVQAQPGATTTLISRRPSPPSHQQAGMPKIAASPGFVDKATLLPQRGAQGAATRSAAVPLPEPDAHPH